MFASPRGVTAGLGREPPPTPCQPAGLTPAQPWQRPHPPGSQTLGKVLDAEHVPLPGSAGQFLPAGLARHHVTRAPHRPSPRPPTAMPVDVSAESSPGRRGPSGRRAPPDAAAAGGLPTNVLGDVRWPRSEGVCILRPCHPPGQCQHPPRQEPPTRVRSGQDCPPGAEEALREAERCHPLWGAA